MFYLRWLTFAFVYAWYIICRIVPSTFVMLEILKLYIVQRVLVQLYMCVLISSEKRKASCICNLCYKKFKLKTAASSNFTVRTIMFYARVDWKILSLRYFWRNCACVLNMDIISSHSLALWKFQTFLVEGFFYHQYSTRNTRGLTRF